MAGEFVSATDIREGILEIKRPTKEALAKATEIYQKTAENPSRVFPLVHTYLEELAKEEQTLPLDTFALAMLIENYPQMPVEVVVDTGAGKIALPMDLIVERFDKNVEVTKKAGIDLESTGKILREKAEKFLKQLSQIEPDEIDAKVFEALEKTGPLPTALMKQEAEFWWDRVIPNIITARSLKQIAKKRQPSLIEKKVMD